MRASLAGRFEDAERLAEESLVLGRHVAQYDARAVFGGVMFMIRIQQGRLDEIDVAVRGYAAEWPNVSAWRAAIAYIHTELHRESDARDEFEHVAADSFQELARGIDWQGTAALLASTCAYLGDARRAAILYQHLQPDTRQTL